MNGINWSYPYIPQMPQIQPTIASIHIIRVNGENGVDAFQMGPNSDALLLDETSPIVWFVQTDGAGYKTKTPYSITPYVPEPSPEMKTMDERFASIDRRLKSLEEALLDEPDN